MVIAALCFRGVQLCIIQVLNYGNTLIVQSILKNMVKKSGLNFITTIKHAYFITSHTEMTRLYKLVTSLWQGCNKVVYNEQGGDKVVTRWWQGCD